MDLLTLEQYRKLAPYEQGYAVYMQAERGGSELMDHQENPYPVGTPERGAWDRGSMQAVLDAQDGEE